MKITFSDFPISFMTTIPGFTEAQHSSLLIKPDTASLRVGIAEKQGYGFAFPLNSTLLHRLDQKTNK